MTRVLFICGKGRKRSPTAAQVGARDFGFATDFAGLSADADERLSQEQLGWADVIAVMEKAHLPKLRRQAGAALRTTRVVCLDIADRYEFMQPELVTILTGKLRGIVARGRSGGGS